MKKKLNIGWFSFTCCEDSSIVFIEMLNEHYKEWFEVINFKHARIFQSKNTLNGIDVAFVEGSISTPAEIERIQKIRSNTKYLITIGACATAGGIQALRNLKMQKKYQMRSCLSLMQMSLYPRLLGTR